MITSTHGEIMVWIPVNHGASLISFLARHFSMINLELSISFISILVIKYSPLCSPTQEFTCIRPHMHICTYTHTLTHSHVCTFEDQVAKIKYV
jgi:hypothetical protein